MPELRVGDRTVRVDSQGFMVDPDDATEYWCSSKILGEAQDPNDRNKIVEYRERSAHTSVNTAAKVKLFLNPSYSNNDSATLNSDSGVIYTMAYNSDGYRTEVKIKEGADDTSEDFISATDYGTGGNPPRLPEAKYLFQDATTTKTGVAKITYDYTFWDTAETQLKTKFVTYPAASAPNNDSASATIVKFYYDQEGKIRWKKSADGTISYYAYDPDFGRMAYKMVDVETDDLPLELQKGSSLWEAWGSSNPPGAPTNTDFVNTDDNALQRVWKYEYNELGRRSKTERVLEGGSKVKYVAYLGRETRTYLDWDSGTDKPRRPVRVRIKNANGWRGFVRGKYKGL